MEMTKNRQYMTRGLGAFALMAMSLVSQAEVKMPAFFSDNMVIQRNTDAKMWGEATPGSTVTVSPGWTGDTYKVKCGKDGKWRISFPTPDAGGPYSVTVSDGTPVTLNNVMLGEVWLCSGQSNMEMPMKGFENCPWMEPTWLSSRAAIPICAYSP